MEKNCETHERLSNNQSLDLRRELCDKWARWILAAIVGLLALFFLLSHTLHDLEPHLENHGRLINSTQSAAPPGKEDVKVPLSVHMMSKCPDALDALSLLILPTMSKVSDKVNLTVAYIGTITKGDDGVSCMHGPSECLGNILELCAANQYPDPKQYLGFTYCMSKEYARIPDRELVHDCALESGMSFDSLNHCASKDDGDFGMNLLRKSVNYSSIVGARYSATIRLDEKERCIRDGGKWKNCPGGSGVDDLVGEIDKLYEKRNGNETNVEL